MWVLFAILVLTGPGSDGKPIINAEPFASQAECEAYKGKVIPLAIAKFPTAIASFTCVKINPLGKIA